MITYISYENLMGQTCSHDLQLRNIITGPNGSGKTTIVNAIELALFGHVRGTEVDKRQNEIYRAYCGTKDGQMSVVLQTEAGELVRSWKKTGGSVSMSTHFRGEKLKAGTDICELTGLSLFDREGFWILTPSQMLSYLCGFTSLSPEELEKLDQEIDAANGKKRQAMDKLGNAKDALVDHEKTLQEMARPQEGMDMSNYQNRIKVLDQDMLTTEKDIREGQRNNATIDSNSKRAAVLLEEITELNEKARDMVEPEQLSGDTEQLKEKQKVLAQNLKDWDNLQRARKYCAENRISPPEQPEATREEMNEMYKSLGNMRQGKGSMTSEESAVLDWCRAWRDEVLVNLDMSEDCITQVIVSLKERLAPIIAKKGSASSDEVYALEEKCAFYCEEWEKYDRALEQYRQAEARFDVFAQDIDKYKDVVWDDQSQNELDEIGEELAARRTSAEAYAAYQDAKKSNQRLIDIKTAELEQVSVDVEKVDLEYLHKKQEEINRELPGLKSMFKELVEYEHQQKITAEKQREISRLSTEVRELKDLELKLIGDKANMLRQIQEVIQAKADRISHPAKVEIEIETGKRPSIRFLRVDGTKRVCRDTLSGREAVEYDIALGYALMDGTGLITAELDAVDALNMTTLVTKLHGLQEQVQILMLSHSIGEITGANLIRKGT